MNSSTGHKIKKRKQPKDVFITPKDLAKKHIDTIDTLPDDIWYDPFMNSGHYYDQFPTDQKCWSEILYGEDFFEMDCGVDVICSNPPYSMIDDVLKKSISLEPRVISYLIGHGNLTARRIEMMNKAGYGLKDVHMLKVFKWYGMSFIVTFEKGYDKNCIQYDRHVYH